jgi:periplasmic divalent cation tolerance protein
VSSAANNRAPVIVLTTLGATADAAAFARTLVTERLAACVNILPPMTSVYRWKGSIEEDTEHQLLIKTDMDRVTALEARFHEIHPYEIAEFVVIPISEGSAAYLGWLADSLAAAVVPDPGGTARS